jgi:hypothetical protein
VTRLCDRHTASKKSCPKCVEALAEMILYASRHLTLPERRKPEAKP